MNKIDKKIMKKQMQRKLKLEKLQEAIKKVLDAQWYLKGQQNKIFKAQSILVDIQNHLEEKWNLQIRF